MTTNDSDRSERRGRRLAIVVVIVSAFALAGLVILANSALNASPTTFDSTQAARTLCPGDSYSITYEISERSRPFTALISVAWTRLKPDKMVYQGRLAGMTPYTGAANEGRNVTAAGLIVPDLPPGTYVVRVIGSFVAYRGITSFEVPVTIPDICPIPTAPPPPTPLPAPPAKQ